MKQTLPDHGERLSQARRRAEWEIGDPSWADVIIKAYCDHKLDAELLADEKGDDE